MTRPPCAPIGWSCGPGAPATPSRRRPCSARRRCRAGSCRRWTGCRTRPRCETCCPISRSPGSSRPTGGAPGYAVEAARVALRRALDEAAHEVFAVMRPGNERSAALPRVPAVHGHSGPGQPHLGGRVPLAEALRAAGESGAACRRVHERLEERRAEGRRRLAAELRKDLDDETIADLLRTMNSPPVFLLLSHDGDDPGRYVAVVTEVWTRNLVSARSGSPAAPG